MRNSKCRIGERLQRVHAGHWPQGDSDVVPVAPLPIVEQRQLLAAWLERQRDLPAQCRDAIFEMRGERLYRIRINGTGCAVTRPDGVTVTVHARGSSRFMGRAVLALTGRIGSGWGVAEGVDSEALRESLKAAARRFREAELHDLADMLGSARIGDDCEVRLQGRGVRVELEG